MKKFNNIFLHCMHSILCSTLIFTAYNVHASEVIESNNCTEKFDLACAQSFKIDGSKKFINYYASLTAEDKSTQKPKIAFIAIHGFKHTVDKTFNAALLAANNAGKMEDVLIVTPIFHADENDPEYQRCMNPESPKGDQKNDLLWSCQGWMEGAMASNDNTFSSFDALDALINKLADEWPSLEKITIAGFSAGGQVVQRYAGYAQHNSVIPIRYVISNPGSWFYFDTQRPVLYRNGEKTEWQKCIDENMKDCDFTMESPQKDQCPDYNNWKYGAVNMPTHFSRSLEEAKKVYAAADIHYMQGALDSSDGPGTVYNLLDKSCAAYLQGPFRMQRGLSFAAYDRALIAPEKNRTVTVVPECAHNVTCVFASKEAHSVLFGE